MILWNNWCFTSFLAFRKVIFESYFLEILVMKRSNKYFQKISTFIHSTFSLLIKRSFDMMAWLGFRFFIRFQWIFVFCGCGFNFRATSEANYWLFRYLECQNSLKTTFYCLKRIQLFHKTENNYSTGHLSPFLADLNKIEFI